MAKKLIAPMTDGCNTMAGNLSGVKKRLMEVVPQLRDLGSCNDHHISNAAKKGLEVFDPDIKEALVHIYFDIGGATGKGLKKKRAFEGKAKAKKRRIKALRKYGSTRFRSYRICTDPVLFNWESIFEYYSTVQKPTERQKQLMKFFVDREFLSKMKLEFLMAATKDINDSINYFEESSTKIHLAYEKMEGILRGQMLKYLKPTVVHDVDGCGGKVVKKSGEDLLAVDVMDKANLLGRKAVFIGHRCAKIMRDLDLTPTSTQVDDFYQAVYKYHQTVTSKLQGYFQTGLACLELKYMRSFAPSKHRNIETPKEIKYLAIAYSKIVDNICPGTGFDKLNSELDEYQVDDVVEQIASTKYNSYWNEVSEITEGEEKIWKKYEVLPRFAKALGTPFNSGSSMERAFSRETDITRDPKRNRMSNETLDAHMQIHYGVECRESRSKCPICSTKEKIGQKDDKDKTSVELKEERKLCVCHCKYAEISDKMLSNCADAARQYKERKADDELLEETTDGAAEGEPDALKRQETLKGLLKKRSTFIDPSEKVTIFESSKQKRKNNSDLSGNAASTSSCSTEIEHCDKQQKNSDGLGSSENQKKTYKIPKKKAKCSTSSSKTSVASSPVMNAKKSTTSSSSKQGKSV